MWQALKICNEYKQWMTNGVGFKVFKATITYSPVLLEIEKIDRTVQSNKAA